MKKENLSLILKTIALLEVLSGIILFAYVPDETLRVYIIISAFLVALVFYTLGVIVLDISEIKAQVEYLEENLIEEPDNSDSVEPEKAENTCENCGESINDNDKCCPSCGVKI